MRRLVYYISLSIDGFIAGPADEIDFFAGSEEYSKWMFREYADALPTHARTHLGLTGSPLTIFDTVVMGRRTYEPALQMGIASPYAHLRQIVFSHTLVPSESAVSIVDSDPVEAVRALKAEDSTLDIYLAGGGLLAGQIMSEIDRLIIKRYPVVAGGGRTAFGPDFSPTAFTLDEVLTFEGGNVVEMYSRVTS